MILKLGLGDMVNNWEMIKYGAVSANALPTNRIEKYTTNLLAKLLSGDVQCWFSLSDDNKVKGMVLTRILKDIGEISHFMVDSVFGYLPTTVEDKKEFLDKMIAFGKEIGCEQVLALTTNAMARNAAERSGFAHLYNIHSIRIGG